MTKDERKEKKYHHDKIKIIREKIAKGVPTTFAERNIVNIENNKRKKQINGTN